MRAKNGVTIVQLIIVIIIMIILATIAISSGFETISEAELSKVYNEITTVKNAVKEADLLITMNPDEYSKEYFFGKTIREMHELGAGDSAYDAKSDIIENFGSEIGVPGANYDSSDEWYFLTNQKVSNLPEVNYREKYSVNKQNLEIDKINNEYMINMSNGKIYIINGITPRQGEDKIYEYLDIVKLYNGVFNN